MKRRRPALTLYHVSSEEGRYSEIVRALSSRDAAGSAYDHAAELGFSPVYLSISPLLEPGDGGRGVCAESAQTHYFTRANGRIVRYKPPRPMPVPLGQIIGKTIDRIEHTTVPSANGDEPCVNLIFTDRTMHGFVLPTDL